MMEMTEDMPIGVFVEHAGIAARKKGIVADFGLPCVSIHCMPWHLLFPDLDQVAEIFRIEKWAGLR
jgi:hypothetical protein